MKGLVILSIISLFLVGFIGAIGITGSAVDGKICCKLTAVVPDAVPSYELMNSDECANEDASGEPIYGANHEIVEDSFCETEDDDVEKEKKYDLNDDVEDEVEDDSNDEENKTDEIIKEENKKLIKMIKERLKAKLSEIEKRKLIQEKNRLKFEAKTGVECPESCTCTGSAMKCTLANGREMTIMAGNSGNTIVQVKGENMTTKVVLYKAEDGKVYGVFKNNETKQVRMLPDQVREKIREKLARQLEKENITLTEDGTYQYDGEKRKRLFFFISVKTMVRAEIDPETGEVLEISKPKWWEFLASDEGNQIVGASCGTVSPDGRETCCKSKGYDTWNTETGECVFNN